MACHSPTPQYENGGLSWTRTSKRRSASNSRSTIGAIRPWSDRRESNPPNLRWQRSVPPWNIDRIGGPRFEHGPLLHSLIPYGVPPIAGAVDHERLSLALPTGLEPVSRLRARLRRPVPFQLDYGSKNLSHPLPGIEPGARETCHPKRDQRQVASDAPLAAPAEGFEPPQDPGSEPGALPIELYG